ncbi:Regulator of chromosome condensation (RCC1) repeat [Novymonas esmeraldas]|uniref:Regulator of chromosome condensation (RCC1) repeat n=1 Tax=Novymonas esmeraldas TaxID=1808958 RepID=A0AAW0F4J8_9TRYP
MEAACRRLYQGDTSSLSDVLQCVEAGQGAPRGKLGARVYPALVTLLLHEGVVLREAPAPDAMLPSTEAFNAMHILAIIGVRLAEEGHQVKSVLLSLGLQRCREMMLDAYFALSRWQRYHVVMFVSLLMSVYGCHPQDLLRSATSVNLLTGSSDLSRASPRPDVAIEATEVIPALPSHRTPTATTQAGGSNRTASPTGPAAPQPPPTASASAGPPRRGNIQNRSAVLVSIPGTSSDLPLQPARWYRELPRRAINAPYPLNPLCVAPGERADDEGGGGRVSPRTPPPLVPEIPMAAQLPTPVVLFAAYHGVGCVPRLPTVDDLARLCAWRERRQQVDARKSPATVASSSSTPVDPRHGWGAMLETAMQIRTSGDAAADAGGPHPFLVRNQAAFVSTNTGTAAFHRRCCECALLRQYLEQGRLLSWGSLAKGALGPMRPRHDRAAPAMPRGASAGGDPSTTGAGGGGAAHSSPDAQTRVAWGAASPPSASQLLPLVAPESRPSARAVAEQHQADPATAVPTPAALTVTSGASAAKPPAATDSGAAGYVYLPHAVHTAVRAAQVACGFAVSYVLTVDGVLYSCGRADSGQLGIGDRSVRYTESGTTRLQRVLLKDTERVVHVAAGTACAVALAGDNALYCWGHNVYGQCLKMPDASRVLTPVRLKAGTYKVLDVCLGQFFGVLLFDDGVMGTWGIASMLGCTMGDKGLEHSLAPDQCKCARQVVHLRFATATPMAAVRAGPWHALALSQNGEVYTWGVGRNGRLGHGTDASEVKPRLVEGLRASFVVDASCSHSHSAVLTSAGAVYVFGENAEGQLGLRGRAPRRLPTMVSLPTKAVAVACAREHTCILLADGDVVACGSHRTCGLGLGYGRCFCAPVRILTNYVTLTLHSGHMQSMAGVVHRRTALMVVGHSTIDEVSRMSSLVVRNGVRCAASGVGFLLVLSENNSLVAVGRGERGQLGIGDCMQPAHDDDVTVAATFTEVHIPAHVIIQHVRCGPDFVLALDDSGAVYGWGSNEHRQLCQPASVAHVFSPARIAAYASERIVQVVCGGTFVVALTADGDVLTHGEALYCGLGAPPSPSPSRARGGDVPSPTRVAGLRDVVTVAAGRRHALAMTASCGVFAWGVGVLGTGGSAGTGDLDAFATVAPTPVRVALSQTIRSIGCGPHNSFAISDDGELWVWGSNRFGECGVPTHNSSTSTSGGVLRHAAGGPRRASDAAADRATAIVTPTSVARQVRDAAFTGQFGVVVFEDGQVRVSGRIRYGGQRYLLPSFHTTPQPPFSIDVNEPRPPRRATPPPTPPPPPRQQWHGGVITEEASEDGDTPSASSSCLALPAAAASATDGRHPPRRPGPPSPRRSRHGASATAVPSSVSLRASKMPPAAGRRSLPPVPARCRSPRVPSSCSTAEAAPTAAAPLAASNSPLPSFSPRSDTHDPTSLDLGHGATPEFSLPSLSGILPCEPRDARLSSTATAAVAGRSDTEEARSDAGWNLFSDDEDAPGRFASPETYLYDDEYTSRGTAAPQRRVSENTPTTSTAAPTRKAASATCGTHTASVAPPAAPAARTVADRLRGGQTPPPPPPPAQRGPRVRAAAVSSSEVPLPTSASAVSATAAPAPSVADGCIVGLRCFAGWEQVCIVMEKHRPTEEEVSMAQIGLQVHLRQAACPARQV